MYMAVSILFWWREINMLGLRPSAQIGLHMELHMEAHIELHMELHMQLHKEVNMASQMQLYKGWQTESNLGKGSK